MPNELLYVLRVLPSEPLQASVCRLLSIEEAPPYVRVAVKSPLSNHGYDGFEGTLLEIRPEGLLVGHERTEVPRLFVPWTNVSYLGDGALLASQIRAELGLDPVV